VDLLIEMEGKMSYRYPNGNVFYRKLDTDLPVCVKGEGIYLYDQEGKKYIDGSGGPLCVIIGHGVAEIGEAIREQAQKVAYVHGSQFTTVPIEEFTSKLAKKLPQGIDKIYIVGSGSEANEAALKLARQYQLSIGNSQRYRVIGRWFSYHGSTLGALSMMGKTGFRKPFLPLVLDFPHIPAPYCYRCPYEKKYPECKLLCARALEKTIQLEGPETISAFIAEPVIGSTLGAVIPPK
jgi:adenosylmethionine-8-amino-7-oxononanoate aminotransferase